MKYCLLIAFIFFATFNSFGQQARPVGYDAYSYKGQLIKIVPSRSGGFGYSVYFRNQLVALQSANPFSMAPSGLKNKSDALKLAFWQVDQLSHTPRSHPLINNRLSKDLAAKLMIDIR
ncbi:MAG TPA: hypothetical protein VKR53_11570 [Puia sp.]|nr:hypothetical protein [Puia sp.]